MNAETAMVPTANHVAGKVIVITGAGSGFGRLIAETTAGLGAKVVASDVDEDAVQAVAKGIEGSGGTAVPARTDVTSKDEMDALAALAVDRLGALDVLVNNAGVMPLAFFADHREAWRAWDRAIDINLKGVINGITAVYDQMIGQGRGHIVNISSIYGNYGTAGSGVYSATKAAVRVLSDSLRVEAQGKIKVTVVRPTGVLGTGLAGTIVNPEAFVGLTGHNGARFGDRVQQYVGGTMPAEQTDVDDVRYWSLTPQDLVDQVVYAINQPWGVTINDITVRATGEDYVF